MARAAYIIKKDGRYWFQKRFAAHLSTGKGLASHCRIALRTADYRVAVSRMLEVARLVNAYEIRPDIVDRASLLMKQMRRFSMRGDGDDVDALVERRTLETLVSRFITEARLRNHPLTTEPADFWPTWMAFVKGNVLIEENVELKGQRSARPQGVREVTIVREPAPTEPVAAGHGFDHAEPLNDTELHEGSTISEVLRAFLDQRHISDGDGRAAEDFGIVIQFMIDLLGDRPLSTVTTGDLVRIENALPNIPHPYGVPKPYQGSLYLRWKYAEEHGWEGLKRISRTRLRNGWHGALRGFLNWSKSKGVYKGPEYEFSLVARQNPGKKERDAWRDDEIKKLFSLPLFTGCRSAAHHWEPGNVFVQNHLYWAYILIFFTGMRPSEIGKLRNENIVRIEGVWYFDLRDADGETEETTVKSAAGQRLIPIPRLLIDLGLLERRDVLVKRGEARLFPEWKVYINKKSGREMWGHDFSKSWQYIKVKFKFDRKAVTLYGGRHTRASWYDAAGIPQRVRIRLLGHAATNVADSYGAIHITPDEAKLVLSKSNAVEEQVAEILVEAKLKADYKHLEASGI